MVLPGRCRGLKHTAWFDTCCRKHFSQKEPPKGRFFLGQIRCSDRRSNYTTLRLD